MKWQAAWWKFIPHISCFVLIGLFTAYFLGGGYWQWNKIGWMMLAMGSVFIIDPVSSSGAFLIGMGIGAITDKHRWVLLASLVYAIFISYFIWYTNGIDLASRPFFLMWQGGYSEYVIHPHSYGLKIFVRFWVVLAVADIGNLLMLSRLLKRKEKK